MAPRSIRIRFVDIQAEIAGIRDLTKNARAESFASSWVMKRAVEHALLIIAEATKRIPDDLKAKRPEVLGIESKATCFATNTTESIPTSCDRS